MSEDAEHRDRLHGAPKRPAGYRPPRPEDARPAEAQEYDATPAVESVHPVKLQTPHFLGAVRIRHVMSALLSQGIAYVTLLLMAILACLLLVLGLLLGSDSEVAEVEIMAGDLGELIGTPDFTDLLATLLLPFQVAGLWLFGTLRFEIGMPTFFEEMFAQFGGAQASAEMTFSFWAPNLLVLALTLWVAVWAGRRITGRGEAPLSQLPVPAKLVVNVVVSAALAGLTLLLTWALAFRQSLNMAQALGEDIPEAELEQMAEYLDVSLSDMEITFFGSAAGLGLFFGAMAFYLIVGLLVSVKRGFFKGVLTRINGILPFINRTPRVVLNHGLIIAIPALLYVSIRFITDGSPGTLTAIPFWVTSAAVFSFILLTSGAIHGSGEIRETMAFGQSESGSMTFYLWGGGASELSSELTAEDEWIFQVLVEGFAWWEVLISIIIGLFALFAAALSWSLVRDARKLSTAGILSFFTLPAVYAVLGAVLTLFGQMRVEASMMGMISGHGALGPAWWSFFILFVVGVIVEALARVCPASLSDSVPKPLRRVLAGKSSSATSARDGAEGPPPPYPGPMGPGEGHPPSMP